MSAEHFDLIVIGGGSGGMACAKRAATYNKKVCIVEAQEFGGTCVNVGCVPKKVMFNAAHVAEVLKEAHQFGFGRGSDEGSGGVGGDSGSGSGTSLIFDWGWMKRARDTYIRRLNGIYESGLDQLGITRVNGWASLLGEGRVRVGDDRVLSADNILIAVGGKATQLDVPGAEFLSSSDDFFALESQPKKVGVVGSGYIAVELAGVFAGLGTDVSLFVRRDKEDCRVLASFDPMLSAQLDQSMRKSGVSILGGSVVSSVNKEPSTGKLSVVLTNGATYGDFDMLISAIGRQPLTEGLALDAGEVRTTAGGYVEVDEYQQTSAKGVLALGDVCGKVELTPMAIAAGRRLADRLFGGPAFATSKADYSNVPTVVFSHPPIGTIGLTEPTARERFGDDNVKVYTSSFVNLWYGPYYGGAAGEKPMSHYKLITVLPTERVVGLHMIGIGSDEALQGFGVAMKMGATKADFDSCVAIHPTAAEEMVTMAPWGLSGNS